MRIFLVFAIVFGLSGSVWAYQPTLYLCAPGDTCVYATEVHGALELPDVLSEVPVTMVWSMDIQPVVRVQTDRPIMETVVDSLGVETEIPTDRYYVQVYLASAVDLLMVNGERTARIIWMDGHRDDHPLDKVSIFALGRAK